MSNKHAREVDKRTITSANLRHAYTTYIYALSVKYSITLAAMDIMFSRDCNKYLPRILNRIGTSSRLSEKPVVEVLELP